MRLGVSLDHAVAGLKTSKKMNQLMDDRRTTTMVPICKPVATLPLFCPPPPPWTALGLLGVKASPTPPFSGGLWPLFDQVCWNLSPHLQVTAKEADDQTEPLDLSTKRSPFRSMTDLSKRDIALKIEYDFQSRAPFPLTSDVFFRRGN